MNIAKQVQPSHQGELEIIGVNQAYLKRGDLNADLQGCVFSWLDTGTHKSLQEASQFVEAIEKRQGYKIVCLEEIAFNSGWINKVQLLERGEELSKNAYSSYLLELAEEA